MPCSEIRLCDKVYATMVFNVESPTEVHSQMRCRAHPDCNTALLVRLPSTNLERKNQQHHNQPIAQSAHRWK